MRCNFRFTGLALSVLFVMGCSSGTTAPEGTVATESQVEVPAEFANLKFSTPAVTHYDDGGRVNVALSSAWCEDGRLVLRGVFAPEDEGYHLYDCKMDKSGVSGIGRPTLMEVTDDSVEAGELITDKKTKTKIDQTLNISLPVYPDGPVTLYLPISFQSAAEGPMQLPVELTYMSCSEKRCNIPVQGVVEELTVPSPAVRP